MHQQHQLGPWDSLVVHSYSEGSKMHVSSCCSNNRISAVGALSLGLGLRVNQTLRILVVSASLMGEAPAQTCLCMSTHIPPLVVGYTGSRAQRREGASWFPLMTTYFPCHSITHLLQSSMYFFRLFLTHPSLPVVSLHLSAVLILFQLTGSAQVYCWPCSDLPEASCAHQGFPSFRVAVG